MPAAEQRVVAQAILPLDSTRNPQRATTIVGDHGYK